MKKRLFLFTVMVVALCAIFAISSGAEVTTYNDAPERTNIQVSTNDVVVFSDGFSCPTGYVFKDKARIENNSSFASACDFSYINEKTGKEYTFADVVKLDIPQGVTYVGLYAGKDLTTLKSISFPDSVESFGNAVFQGATGLEECVFEHGEDSAFTVLPAYMFYNCKSLKALSLPDSITKIEGSHHFVYCTGLTAVYLSKNITTWESSGGGVKGATFDDATNVYFVNEPFTYDNIPTKPTVYYFPAELETMSNQCVFRGCKNLNDVLVFGEKITEAPNAYLFQNGPENTIVFLGDMETISTKYWGSTSTIIFANKNDKSSADIASYSNTRTAVFCNAQDNTTHLESPRATKTVPATCYSLEKITTNCFCGYEMSATETPNSMIAHSYVEDYDCTTDNLCEQYENCGAFIARQAQLHTEAHDVIYENGFLEAGVYNIYCINENCTQRDKNEALEPMFTALGYSYKLNSVNNAGISAKFGINNYALKLYEEYEGDIHYGIFAVNKNSLNDGAFTVNGKLNSEKGIQVEVTSNAYSYFTCTVNGFSGSEAHKALGLVIAGYVYETDEDGNVGKVTYVQKSYASDDENEASSAYTEMLEKSDATLGVVTIGQVEAHYNYINEE